MCLIRKVIHINFYTIPFYKKNKIAEVLSEVKK